jgi:hypothetical protein
VREPPAKILVKEFIDIDLDIIGWYAFGHHHPQNFMAAVAQYVSLDELFRISMYPLMSYSETE